MDDGMFSREAITAYPPLLDMLTDLDALLPATTFDPLLDALCHRLRDPVPIRSASTPPSGC
jgi:hypothetical protein